MPGVLVTARGGTAPRAETEPAPEAEAGGKVATAEDEPEAEVMGVVLQVPVKAAASAGEEMALGALAGSTVEVAMGMAI